jgi:hypothetical protein
MNTHNPATVKTESVKQYNFFRFIVGGLAATVALVFGLLAIFVVPAPSNRTATEVSGILISMSRPHPDYGDIGIVMDNGQRYYINRADEVAHLNWERLLAEVKPGDQVHLTVVTPIFWHKLAEDTKTSRPVAGLRTADTVYMDPDIAAKTWVAQGHFSVIALLSSSVLLICMMPNIFRVFNRRLPLGI